MHSGELKIYRLDQVPPQLVDISPPLFEPNTAFWSVDPGSSIPAITFQIPVSTLIDAPCRSFLIDLNYTWQNGALKLTKLSPPSLEEMEHNLYCTRLLAYTLRSSQYPANSIMLNAYKDLLDLPFIEKNITEWEFPDFRVEEERFKLAIFLSDHGDEAGANEQIQKIRAGTDTEHAQWREDALGFFTARRSPQALFQFCLESQTCQNFLAINEILSIIPPAQLNEAPTQLEKIGVNVFSSGDYDFDLDGQSEKWLIFKDYGSSCGGFWSITSKAGVVYSRFVGHPCLYDESDWRGKIEIKQLGLYHALPYYQVSINGKETLDSPSLYWPLDQKDPTADYWVSYSQVNIIQNRLLLGQIAPADALAQFETLQKPPEKNPFWSTGDQPHLLYLIGLCQELTGDKDSAAATYLELWKTYPEDAFSLMAYAKLESAR
jgi:hypothetical protein